ncbi:hypothetical protein E4U43_000322 [Claviceps pusilla]|uniref:Yeast cell wall synthesis Kre9/Knh1-like N-terminal domain-containing protein n=1 Tax=Claviceps pusilla TaxID=123648 RepID=A0A9P7NA65_9HYPO|nr:hypothetical protein E4U43_000322 [Claviceps pusilla]
MRFPAAAILAFAASTLAQTPDFDSIYSPKKNEIVAAGSALNLTWDAPAKYDSGTISIELIGGATQNTQQPIAHIASGVQNSAKTYIWNVDASLGAENVYGLVFKLESDPSIFQYSNPFHIKASDSKPTGSHSTSTTAMSSSSEPATNFVTKTEEFTTTVPCTTNTPDSMSTYSAPTGSSAAPTASNPSNPIMTSTSAISPVPTSGASSIHVGSIGILAVAAAALLL